jgi:competence protein ComEA
MPKFIRILPGGRRLLLLAAPALLGLGAVGAAYLYSSAGAAPAVPDAPVVADLSAPAPTGLLVDVIGAVSNPGLYRMNRGDRVYDAIAAAGGLLPEADPTRLPNMAGRLKDGEQVKVPFAKSIGTTTVTRINLNTATLEELEMIPGFSLAFATAVIDYRTNFGGFQNIRELVEVLGMSEADFVIAKRYVAL